MKDFFKLIYRFKIRTMFYFSIGYNEISAMASSIKDIAIMLGFAVVVFKVHLSVIGTGSIFLTVFLFFLGLGFTLKKTGMSDYDQKIKNSINPELQIVRKIAKHLGVDVGE